MFEVWQKRDGRDQFEQSFEKKAQALAWVHRQLGDYIIKPDELEEMKIKRRAILRKMATRERRVTELRAEIRELDRHAYWLKVHIERMSS